MVLRGFRGLIEEGFCHRVIRSQEKTSDENDRALKRPPAGSGVRWLQIASEVERCAPWEIKQDVRE